MKINISISGLKVGLVISIGFLFLSIIGNFLLWRDLKTHLKKTEELNAIIHQMDKIVYQQTFCEANVRAYIISKDQYFLDEFILLKDSLRKNLHVLSNLQYNKKTIDFIRQSEKRVELLNQKMHLALRPEENLDSINQLLHSGHEMSKNILILKNNLENNELKTLQENQIEIDREIDFIETILISSLCISIILCIVIYYITKRYLKQKTAKVDELKALNEQKNKFFSIISHDLKGPSSMIVHLNKMLLETFNKPNKDGIHEMMSMNLNSSIKLKTLIDNLLIWSRTQMNRIELSFDEVNIHASVNSTIELLEDTARFKNVTLLNETDSTVSVYADKNMLETTLRNIIHNAIKYSYEHSKVTIRTEVMNNLATIVITDQGIGMDERTLQKLLSDEGISSARGTLNEEGTGIGLMLCKDFIRRNQGNLEFESVLEIGTTAKITLNLYSFATLYKCETSHWLE